MALGKRANHVQQELFLATADVAQAPGHVFYERLGKLLAGAGFDRWAENACQPYYADGGRPGIPPGTYFRMLLAGYFEGIDSQRGIAWRCADSLSLKKFLGYGPTEPTPDHSSLTKIRQRLPEEVYARTFEFALTLIAEHKLLSAREVGVDSTTLEANAAMKSIVRRDTGENWRQYVTTLMREEGAIGPDEQPSAAEVAKFDRQRKNKKVANDQWHNPHDPDAKIARMKDGRTHLAYKAEHVVDLKTDAILAAEIYGAHESDAATLVPSVERAQDHVDATETCRRIGKIAADKAYHAIDALLAVEQSARVRAKTYIPERETDWNWTNKSPEAKRAVLANRARTKRDYGKGLQRKRSERVERSFAHVCHTGGGRRSWLRGLTNVRKHHLIKVAAQNLGLILRKLLGAGKPRAYAARYALGQLLPFAPTTLRRLIRTIDAAKRPACQSPLRLAA
jgi:transposase